MFVTHENDDSFFFHYMLGKGNDIKREVQETNDRQEEDKLETVYNKIQND